jgi:hypothetical protein
MKPILNATLAVVTGAAAGVALNVPTAAAALPIRLNVVVHNDIPAPLRARLEADYLQPWVKEMESLSGRRVELRFSEAVPELSDLDYRTPFRHDANRVITQGNVTFWSKQRDGNWNHRLDKTLVLVNGTYVPQDPSLPELVGEATFQGMAGWASLRTYSAAGHELGHMFGATHENAKLLFNGWFCETYTYPARANVRSNCYRYSDKNREAIRAYLSEAP